MVMLLLYLAAAWAQDVPEPEVPEPEVPQEPAPEPEVPEEPAPEPKVPEEPARSPEVPEEPAPEPAVEPSAMPVEPAPETVAAPPPPSPAAELAVLATPRGELRFGFVGDQLEELDGAGGLAFQVTRARVGSEFRLAPWAKALVQVDIIQTTDKGTGIDGWKVTLPLAYVEANTGDQAKVEQTVTVGVQKTLFGFRSYYELETGWFIPHPEAFKDLGRRSGLIQAFDLGVMWDGRVGPATLALQVTNGGGWNSVETDLGKQGIARIQLDPIEAVSLTATALINQTSDRSDTTVVAGQLGAHVQVGPASLLVEGLGGRSWQPAVQTDFAGFAAALKLSLPLPLEALEQFAPVFALQRWDPALGRNDGQAWTAIQAGATVIWQTDERVSVWTGLGWESRINEDTENPVAHSGALQFGVKR
jgi:hypothetical protein